MITDLIDVISSNDGINDKAKLSAIIAEEFGLIKDRSVFYCNEYAIRFCKSNSFAFSNTVLSLSNLQKFDNRPFFVCVVTPLKNHLLLSNTTFLKKISHSSQCLSMSNIKGSFNGSDILRIFHDIQNIPENFDQLYRIHESIGFEQNLARLVESTNNIVGTGHQFEISTENRKRIFDAPIRATDFNNSDDYISLLRDLDDKVEKNSEYILLASLIENVNIRGRVIEYLIAGDDNELREKLIESLITNQKNGLPRFSTENSLGDYTKIFDNYHTETDVKTKIMFLDSNPKGYNIDKLLEFLSEDKSVFMFYFIGIDLRNKIKTVLTSIFDARLINGTYLLKHWAGRNSRGVSQFDGRMIKDLILFPENKIVVDLALNHLHKMIDY